MGFLKDFMTRFRVPEGTNWGWYQNAEVDKLGAEVMQTFDDVEQTKILQRLHEIAERRPRASSSYTTSIRAPYRRV